MIYREHWKTQIREEQIVVNKTDRELLEIFTFNSGEVRTHRYAAGQIHALIAEDNTDDYQILLDVTSPVLGRRPLMLTSFKKETERDAMLHDLTAALQLAKES